MKALLEQLAAAGYTVSATNGRLRLRYQRGGEPDPTAVAPLLSEVRAHKAAVFAYIRAESGAPQDARATLQRCNALGAASAPLERNSPPFSGADSVAGTHSVAVAGRTDSVAVVTAAAMHAATLFGDPLPESNSLVWTTALQRCSVAPGFGARAHSERCAHCASAAAYRLPSDWGPWSRWPLCEGHYAPIAAARSQGWRYVPQAIPEGVA